jgi:hypothetical protein
MPEVYISVLCITSYYGIFILEFCILLRVFYQGYWKNGPWQQLFKVFIYIYFAATCFGPRWPASGGIHNNFREVTSLQRIRCFCVIGLILHTVWQILPSSI